MEDLHDRKAKVWEVQTLAQEDLHTLNKTVVALYQFLWRKIGPTWGKMETKWWEKTEFYIKSLNSGIFSEFYFISNIFFQVALIFHKLVAEFIENKYVADASRE